MKSADKVQTPNPPPQERKTYTPPRLVSYGHVKDIVQGGGGFMMDASGRFTKSCWIAEALYGADDPRTIMLRAWVRDVYVRRRSGWVFAALYMIVGRRVATGIQDGYVPRALLRPLFDWLFEKAFLELALGHTVVRH